LCVKDLEAGQGNDTGGEVVLVLEGLDSLETDTDLGTGGNEGDIGLLLLESDVTTLGSLLDGGTLELGEVRRVRARREGVSRLVKAT